MGLEDSDLESPLDVHRSIHHTPRQTRVVVSIRATEGGPGGPLLLDLRVDL
jgi:hypothetical protein